MMHRQVMVKANVMVDAGVADLVQALSRIPDLETLESCESIDDQAWVSFWYHRENDSLEDFVSGILAPALFAKLGDSIRLSIQYTASNRATGEIFCRPGETAKVVDVLRDLYTDNMVPHDVALNQAMDALQDVLDAAERPGHAGSLSDLVKACEKAREALGLVI